MDIGIIGDKSNEDVTFAPFLLQSFRQGVPPLLLNEDIIV
jgi:hypothetical protein